MWSLDREAWDLRTSRQSKYRDEEITQFGKVLAPGTGEREFNIPKVCGKSWSWECTRVIRVIPVLRRERGGQTPGARWPTSLAYLVSSSQREAYPAKQGG